MDGTFTIALAGNPNSGKTTLFNALTGASQYVGNWPGVTVEKKSGRLRKQDQVEVIYQVYIPCLPTPWKRLSRVTILSRKNPMLS